MSGYRQILCSSVFALACVVLAATPAAAQFDRGQISGQVKDAQGAVVPGATVTATNQQTQVATTTVTDSTGYYTFPNLPAAKYNLAAELQGFKKAFQENVALDAAGSLSLNFSLEPGTVTEQVLVTAESPRLQSDVGLRKTIESKDIEQVPFSGRNPIGVVGLKAGVIGGSFNNYGFSDLGNGNFNINGSRTDENNITIDGATAIRTRSNGAIIGIQNVDAIQEVQVLTGDYMPEYGRVSGGQIRMVTKGGGNRFSGTGSFFLRSDALQANTWSRNNSGNPDDRKGAAPFTYRQPAFSVGGPVLKDKLFFFVAEEWVHFRMVQTNLATVPTALMRTGNFSELLVPNNGFTKNPVIITDPSNGQPFPGNIITGSLSPNGLALLNAYPLPTPGFRSGTNNLTMNSENPQDQRKDNVRLDYRLNAANTFTYRYGKYNWKAVDAFRGTFPYARTDWNRPNTTQTASWTSTLSNNLVNEAAYTFSHDEVYINVFKTDLYSRSKYGITYPYLFPDFKEIPDKIPTISPGSPFSEIDGGPYPSSSTGPIHTFSDALTWVKSRHTVKTGVVLEYSGENDFDQINVQAIPGSTNNQNGRFQFTDTRPGGTGFSLSDMAMGLFTNYAEIGQRALTKWRALSTDVFVQDSWRPRSNLTIEGGVRYVLWPPWHALQNNIATFDPTHYSTTNQAFIDPKTGLILSGPRYNGIVLPGDGFPSSASDLAVYNDPAVKALFVGAPLGLTETHKNVFEPRAGVSYRFNEKTILKGSGGVFHNRVTLNDSLLLGGNPPFQPQVSVSNGIADNPGAGGGAASLPFSMTAIDPVFKHPVAYMYSGGVQREAPLGFVIDAAYVGRLGRNLQRERDINQPVAGTLQANPGVNPAALRPYKGYGVIRLSENVARSTYNGLLISADRRYQHGFKFGMAYTLSHSMDNASTKRDILFNSYDDSGFWGNSSFDRRHVFTFYYIYDLPFFQKVPTSLEGRTLGAWQISGATFYRSGTPLWVTRQVDTAGTGDTFSTPWNLIGDPNANSNKQLSNGATVDQNFWFNPLAYGTPQPGTFGNAPRNNMYGPGQYQWDIAVFKNVPVRGRQSFQFRAEMFNFLNHPNFNNPSTDPTSSTFGRVTSKDNSRRDVQLSLRYSF
jgi:hypothetical protein